VDPSFGRPSYGVSADEHPHGDIRAGQAFMSDVVHAFMESPHWKRGALFITYDEWGGFFDHVRPPRVPDARNSRKLDDDFGQMGFRIPVIAVSPYVRRGDVQHSVYGFESILKMIEYRFGLKPLTRRDAYANNIARSFDWESAPRLEVPQLPDPAAVLSAPCLSAPGQRPHDHDLVGLLTSGYLDSLGFDYRPATPSSTYREPSRMAALADAP
jgi:phospholipase C